MPTRRPFLSVSQMTGAPPLRASSMVLTISSPLPSSSTESSLAEYTTPILTSMTALPPVRPLVGRTLLGVFLRLISRGDRLFGPRLLNHRLCGHRLVRVDRFVGPSMTGRDGLELALPAPPRCVLEDHQAEQAQRQDGD